MVEYHVPSEKEFRSFVLEEFNYLVTEYSFHEEGPNDYNPFSVRFKKNDIIIEISGYSYGFATGVDILHNHDESKEAPHKYWLSTFVQLRKPELLEHEFPDKRGQLRQLKKAAVMLRECAVDILSGQLDVLPEIKKLQDTQKEQTKIEDEKQELSRIDAKALNAFGQKDYRHVVELLEPVADKLAVAQRKRLEYARKHL
jgi:hypothetical protein